MKINVITNMEGVKLLPELEVETWTFMGDTVIYKNTDSKYEVVESLAVISEDELKANFKGFVTVEELMDLPDDYEFPRTGIERFQKLINQYSAEAYKAKIDNGHFDQIEKDNPVYKGKET